MTNVNKATQIGLLAVLLWSLTIGLLRSVTESLGATLGAALIFTVAALLLSCTVGPTKVRQLPRRYLICGGALFVAYEMCLALSIGYAHTSRQAIEVGMVNYLWPALTMLSAIVFNKQRSSVLIVPGFVIALTGVCWVLGGEQGLDFPGMLDNVRSNPLSYGLAFVGALIWAAYCTVTARLAQGKNGVTLFFTLVALVLWAKFLIVGGEPMAFTTTALVHVALAGAATGFGYAAWNFGILHGNVTLLAGASYFIPVLSAAMAAMVLRTSLSLAFWQGAAMVCVGSTLCWLATRTKPKAAMR